MAGPSVYTLKESPYSSHSIISSLFPAPGKGQRVLDVGCGNGHVAAMLASRGYDVTGIECAGGYGTDFPPEVNLIEADLAHGLPPVPHRFAHVICADVLEHLPRPERLLEGLRGVLGTEGRLVASLPNSGNIYFRLNVAAGRFPHEDKGLFDRTHLRFYVWSGWRDLFEHCGFDIETCHPTGIPVGLVVPPSRENSAPVRFAERVCYEMARFRKTLFAYQFVVEAKVTHRRGDQFQQP